MINKKLLSVLGVSILISMTISCTQKLGINYRGVIPAPVSVTKGKGRLQLKNLNAVTIPSSKLTKLGELISNEFLLAQIKMSEHMSENTISIIIDSRIVPEGYQLDISSDRIVIRGGDEAGAFYAFQTLKQLRIDDDFPVVSIKDHPRFKYRGMMLDVARYFYPVKDVKKFINLMALHKYNKFHWHLTDDQGWRIEIIKYPLLTAIGSIRHETMVGDFRDSQARKDLWEEQGDWDFRKEYVKDINDYDGVPHKGFYTQEQVREIIQYAADRHIEVIPEIDVPGHASAALAAYPEYGCKAEKYEVSGRWSIHPNILCPTEDTLQFLKDIFGEIIELFPSEYIHIGGDEANKTHWEDCDVCQKIIRDKKLGDEMGLQSYLIGQLDQFITSKKRKMVGWDEILEGGLSPNATVMSWRGEDGGIEAAKKKHNVIMAPGNYTYFDKYQTQSEWNKKEPLAQWGLISLETVYNYDPIPKALSIEERQYVLGAEGCMWTEYIPNYKKLEYMALPRMAALSESVWSQPSNKNWLDFKKRLLELTHIYEANDFNYSRSFTEEME